MAVHIIGGGVIGLCSAYFLQASGEEVTVIDKHDLTVGCSFGNAGMIVPSHFIPLAAPGIIKKGIRWMFDRSSPFFVRPAFDKALTQWLWAFYKSCNQKHVSDSMAVLLEANQLSRSLYSEFDQLFKNTFDQPVSRKGFGFEKKGLMMLFRDRKTQDEELATAELANSLGLEAEHLDYEGIKILNPGCTIDAMGAIYYPGDAHLNPTFFMEQLRLYLRSKNVKFILSEVVLGFRQSGGKIESIRTDNREIKVDKVLIAAGSWSGKLLKALNKKLLVQDGKGYSIQFSGYKNIPSIPTILAAEKVSFTPFHSSFRLGGTLEISQLSNKIDIKRLDGIVHGFRQYFPAIPVEVPAIEKVWHGFRPMSPDGLPYIGKLSGFANAFVNTGHAMMGMSLGPASGLLVSQIINEETPFFPIDSFNPARF